MNQNFIDAVLMNQVRMDNFGSVIKREIGMHHGNRLHSMGATIGLNMIIASNDMHPFQHCNHAA
jgi:hypothetical protein